MTDNNVVITTEDTVEITDDGTLSILIHASSKVGKSTLTSTSPTPILVLDAEGGWRFIRKSGFNGKVLRKTHWNPKISSPPRYDGTWDVCIVTVREWGILPLVYQWLTQTPHDFASIIFDSITEVQRRCKQNLVGSEAMKIQDWGSLLAQMDILIRNFRDLVLLPDTAVRIVIFVAETGMDEGKWRPMMQGQIRRSLPYWVDICGYLFVDPVLDAQGQPTGKVRKLLIGPHAQFESGERVQGILGDVVVDPNISTMMHDIFSSNEIRQSLQMKETIV